MNDTQIRGTYMFKSLLEKLITTNLLVLIVAFAALVIPFFTILR